MKTCRKRALAICNLRILNRISAQRCVMSFDCRETKDGSFRNQSLMYLKKPICAVFFLCLQERSLPCNPCSSSKGHKACWPGWNKSLVLIQYWNEICSEIYPVWAWDSWQLSHVQMRSLFFCCNYPHLCKNILFHFLLCRLKLELLIIRIFAVSF